MTVANNEAAALLVAQAPDAMIYAGLDGAILGWNAAAERVFGHPVTEMLGKSLDEIIPEPMRQAHWAGYDRALADGHVQPKFLGTALPTRVRRADGAEIFVELSFGIIQDASGVAIGAVAHARDITERFERDRTMRRRLRELEQTAGA